MASTPGPDRASCFINRLVGIHQLPDPPRLLRGCLIQATTHVLEPLDQSNYTRHLDVVEEVLATCSARRPRRSSSGLNRNNEALGISDERLTGLAASMGDLLVPMGFSRDAAAGLTTDTKDHTFRRHLRRL